MDRVVSGLIMVLVVISFVTNYFANQKMKDKDIKSLDVILNERNIDNSKTIELYDVIEFDHVIQTMYYYVIGGEFK